MTQMLKHWKPYFRSWTGASIICSRFLTCWTIAVSEAEFFLNIPKNTVFLVSHVLLDLFQLLCQDSVVGSVLASRNHLSWKLRASPSTPACHLWAFAVQRATWDVHHFQCVKFGMKIFQNVFKTQLNHNLSNLYRVESEYP